MRRDTPSLFDAGEPPAPPPAAEPLPAAGTWRHAFRVHFASGEVRDVYGQSEEGAKHTAVAAQRLTILRTRRRRCDTEVTSVRDIGHRGTDQHYCPRCREKGDKQ